MERNASLNEPILETRDTFLLFRLGRQARAKEVRALESRLQRGCLQFHRSGATMAGTSIFGIVWGETE